MSTNTILLAAPAAIMVVILAVHCLFKRGMRLTFTFFVGAFVFGAVRGNLVHLITDGERPYIINEPVVMIGAATAIEIVGWIYALYISWNIGETIANRYEKTRGMVFPTLVCSCVLMLSIMFTLESVATRAGWWHWRNLVDDSPIFVIGMGGAVFAWFSVGFDFLLPFFLIECSGIRSRLRYLALLPFALHMSVHELTFTFGNLGIMSLWHWIMMMSLYMMPLVFSTRFAYPAHRPSEGLAGIEKIYVLRDAPFVGVAVMLGVVYVMEIFLACMPHLMLFSLPLVILTWLSRVQRSCSLSGVGIAQTQD
jgi:hypothetical protein